MRSATTTSPAGADRRVQRAGEARLGHDALQQGGDAAEHQWAAAGEGVQEDDTPAQRGKGHTKRHPDSDADGINVGDEVDTGTNPLSGDSDNDGLPDAYELANGLDPLNSDCGHQRCHKL